MIIFSFSRGVVDSNGVDLNFVFYYYYTKIPKRTSTSPSISRVFTSLGDPRCAKVANRLPLKKIWNEYSSLMIVRSKLELYSRFLAYWESPVRHLHAILLDRHVALPLFFAPNIICHRISNNCSFAEADGHLNTLKPVK